MNTNSEITIELTPRQQTLIMKKCGFTPKPFVTDGLSLTMLSLAATAKNSDILPLISRLSICNEILESRQKGGSNRQPYTVTLELSARQREIIKSVVNKDWKRVIFVPDDFDIIFKEVWDSGLTVQHIGQSLVIVSEKNDYRAAPDKIVIKLPEAAENNTTFGTGNHPTTQIVLCLLEKYLKPNSKVLDIGTGSGILAIAAAKLGAKKVLAVDIDAKAVETAKMSAGLNDVAGKIEFKTGTIDLFEDKFEMVTGNLFPKIIISLAGSLADKVTSDGLLLLSGLVSDRIPEITGLMQDAGFEHLESLSIDIWGGIAFRKKNR